MTILLAVHLGIILRLFLIPPYSKFALGVYCLAALLKTKKIWRICADRIVIFNNNGGLTAQRRSLSRGFARTSDLI